MQGAGCGYDGYDAYERIPFASGNRSYTKRFVRYVVELLRIVTIKGVARLLGVSWDLIKDIHRQHLRRHYARPSLKGLKNIGIDELPSGRAMYTRLSLSTWTQVRLCM